MPEKLAFHDVFGYGAAVHSDKRTVPEFTVGMNGLGCQAFPGPSFSGDQNRGMHILDIFNQPDKVLHNLGLPDHALKPGPNFIFLFQKNIFLFTRPVFNQFFDHHPQFIRVKWL